MENYTLTLYGGQSVSNNKCVGSDYLGQRDSANRIESLPNVSVGGETVVNSSNSAKPISIKGTFVTPTITSNLEAIIADYEKAFNDGGRKLHICRRWINLMSVPVGGGLEDGWAVGGRGNSIEVNTDNYQFDDGALQIGLLSSGDNFIELSKDNLGGDVGSMISDGAIEFLLYVEDATYMQSIDIKVGTDTSNYFAKTGILSAFDTSSIVNGWNLISVNVNEMSETGVVDPYSLNYFYTKINFSSSETGDNTILFGGLWWQDETHTKNYRCYLSGFSADAGRINNGFAPFTISLYCADGFAETTGYYTLKNEAGLTSTVYRTRVFFDGSLYPNPHWRVTLNTVTNMDKVILSNDTTGESIEIDETFSAGDVIELDMENWRITKNNVAIDYNNVLPTFVLGSNRLSLTVISSGAVKIEQTTNNTSLGGVITA